MSYCPQCKHTSKMAMNCDLNLNINLNLRLRLRCVQKQCLESFCVFNIFLNTEEYRFICFVW